MNSSPWWKCKAAEIANAVRSHSEAINTFRSSRLRRVEDLVTTLEREEWRDDPGQKVTATHPVVAEVNGRGGAVPSNPSDTLRPSYNKLRMDMEALCAMIFRDPPDVSIAAINATYEVREQVRRMQAALDATMNHDLAAEELFAPTFYGFVLGWGGCFPEVVDGVVRYRHVREHQVCWDPIEARYGDPKSLHYWAPMDRGEVIARLESWDTGEGFSEAARRRAIKDVEDLAPASEVSRSAEDETPYARALARYGDGGLLGRDMIDVSWSWRVSRSRTAKDGRAVFAAHGGDGESVALRDMAWERTVLPIVMWTPYTAYEGAVCSGAGAMHRPYQEQIDHLWETMSRLIAKLVQPKMAIADKHFDEVAAAIREEGVVPIRLPDGMFGGAALYDLITHAPLGQQALDWLDRVDATSTKAIGSNEGVQQGGSQLGANASGRALLVEDDRVIGRHATPESRWYTFRLRVAERTLDVLDDAAAADSSFRVRLRGDGRAYAWRELSLPREEYTVQLEERGVLARRLPGRVAQIQELADAQVLDPADAAAEISGMADLRKLTNTAMAGRELVIWQLAGMAMPGQSAEEYSAYLPTERTPLDLAQRLGLAEYQAAVRQGAKQETLDRLQNYMDAAKKLATEAAPATGQAVPVDPGAMGIPGDTMAVPAELPPGAMDAMIPPDMGAV